jgi:hypothetical protein
MVAHPAAPYVLRVTDHPFDRSRRRALRTGAALCLTGVAVTVGAALSNSAEALTLGIFTA